MCVCVGGRTSPELPKEELRGILVDTGGDEGGGVVAGEGGGADEDGG